MFLFVVHERVAWKPLMCEPQEHVAHQVRKVIAWREKWLAQQGLPTNTLMNYEQKEAFLQASKEEYHNRPEQRERQERDAAFGPTTLRQKKKSR